MQTKEVRYPLLICEKEEKKLIIKKQNINNKQ